MIRRTVLTLLFSFAFCAFGQTDHKQKFILLIDGEVPVATISKGKIILKDSLGNNLEVSMKYNVGELAISLTDFEHLARMNPKNLVTFQFTFIDLSNGKNIEYIYNEEMKAQCFLEDYLIFKVYNYQKVKKKKSKNRSSYGIEYSIPSFSVIITK